MDKIIFCYISKYGLPTLAESGGASEENNNGYAFIVSNKNGQRKVPIYIPKYGKLINGEHAFFVIRNEDIIVESTIKNKNTEIYVYRIKSINIQTKEVSLDLIEIYTGDNSFGFSNSKYYRVISTAITKASTFNCKNPFYFAERINLNQKKILTN